MREVDLLVFLVPFEHREIDDPAELEAVLPDEIEVLADLGACGPGEFHEGRRFARDKEHGIAGLQPELRAKLFGALRPDIVCHRTTAAGDTVFLGKENVTEAGLSL